MPSPSTEKTNENSCDKELTVQCGIKICKQVIKLLYYATAMCNTTQETQGRTSNFGRGHTNFKNHFTY